MFPLNPSDVMLILDLIAASVVAVYFAVGKPRVWFRDWLGWVIFSYAVALIALLVLIVYGIVFGQRIDEAVRLLVATGLFIALVSKGHSMYRERSAARMADKEHRRQRRIPIMSDTPDTPAEGKTLVDATNIWYKGKRVLRTFVQVIIPAFLGFSVVLPLIIEALGLPVDSELRLWLVGVALGVSAVASAIARVMAIPAVNAWLIKIGLGSVPKDAVTTRMAPSGAPVIVVQEDPKAAPLEGHGR